MALAPLTENRNIMNNLFRHICQSLSQDAKVIDWGVQGSHGETNQWEWGASRAKEILHCGARTQGMWYIGVSVCFCMHLCVMWGARMYLRCQAGCCLFPMSKSPFFGGPSIFKMGHEHSMRSVVFSSLHCDIRLPKSSFWGIRGNPGKPNQVEWRVSRAKGILHLGARMQGMMYIWLSVCLSVCASVCHVGCQNVPQVSYGVPGPILGIKIITYVGPGVSRIESNTQ